MESMEIRPLFKESDWPFAVQETALLYDALHYNHVDLGFCHLPLLFSGAETQSGILTVICPM